MTHGAVLEFLNRSIVLRSYQRVVAILGTATSPPCVSEWGQHRAVLPEPPRQRGEGRLGLCWGEPRNGSGLGLGMLWQVRGPRALQQLLQNASLFLGILGSKQIIHDGMHTCAPSANKFQKKKRHQEELFPHTPPPAPRLCPNAAEYTVYFPSHESLPTGLALGSSICAQSPRYIIPRGNSAGQSVQSGPSSQTSRLWFLGAAQGQEVPVQTESLQHRRATTAAQALGGCGVWGGMWGLGGRGR